MPATEIRERLNRLKDHGFITGWIEVERRWFVDCAVVWGPYTRSQISAWIDGANAMGAAP